VDHLERVVSNGYFDSIARGLCAQALRSGDFDLNSRDAEEIAVQQNVPRQYVDDVVGRALEFYTRVYRPSLVLHAERQAEASSYIISLPSPVRRTG